ncbi:MAG TPA: hypothetical protein VH814_05185 [Steroidobacteraceae bacterium]
MSLQPTLPACVIDMPLALSPYGLVIALRLAQTTRVWLSPTLWSIIEDQQFYLAHPPFVALLAGCADADTGRARLGRVVAQWRTARDQLGLDARERIFWPGEKASEAVIPKGGDMRFMQRLDTLAAQLDRKWQGRRVPAAADREGQVDMQVDMQVDILADCARDTIALAASLAEERPLVLTTRPADGAPPQLGKYLDDSGIPCPHLDDLTALRLLRSSVAPLLVTAGLVEIAAASGLRLAAVSLVTSGATLLTDETVDDEGIDDEVTSVAPERDLSWNLGAGQGDTTLWDGAAAAWYELP